MRIETCYDTFCIPLVELNAIRHVVITSFKRKMALNINDRIYFTGYVLHSANLLFVFISFCVHFLLCSFLFVLISFYPRFCLLSFSKRSPWQLGHNQIDSVNFQLISSVCTLSKHKRSYRSFLWGLNSNL